MVRNAIDRTSEFIRSDTTSPAFVGGPDSVNTTSSTGLIRAMGRDDISMSDGSRPTHYGAWDLTVEPLPRNYFRQKKIRRYTRVNGKWAWVYATQTRTLAGKKAFDRHDLKVFGMATTYGSKYRPTSFPEVRNRAITKALNKLSEADVNVATSLGELRESASLMAGSLYRLAEFLHLLRKKDWNGLKKATGLGRLSNVHDGPKSLANNWLAYKLGWQPLINDITSAHAAIMEVLARDPDIRVEAREDMSPRWINTLSGKTVEGHYNRFCRVGITAKITKPSLYGLSALGLTNPAQLAWELSPLSFLFDYFVEVGSFLNALDSPLGLVFQHGYVTEGLEADCTITDSFNHAQLLLQDNWTTAEPIRWKVKAFTFERTGLYDFPIPRLTIGSGLSSASRASIAAALKVVGR